ncbi:MAG: hypothetical protein J6V88_02435 [Kiritimatiellae bacterium]|nr:hypothetical protein [Kiritimatiellia bacterium]
MEKDFTEKDFEILAHELRSLPKFKVKSDFTQCVMRRIAFVESIKRFSKYTAIAASLTIALGTSFLFSSINDTGRSANSEMFKSSNASQYAQAYTVKILSKDSITPSKELSDAVETLVKTQGAEGGWNNIALTTRNVAALSLAATAGVDGAREAYRKGVRYLRKMGRLEMSASEFAKLAQSDASRLLEMGETDIAKTVAMAGKF